MTSKRNIEKRIEKLEERIEQAEETMSVPGRIEKGSVDEDPDQRLRSGTIKQIVGLVEENSHETDKHPETASVERILDVAELVGIERSNAEHEVEELRRRGEVYEPVSDRLRRT